MRRRARFTLRAAISVILGTVTSVAVAWTIAFVKGENIATPGEKICILKPDALLSLNEARAVGRRQRMIWYVDSIDAKMPADLKAMQQEKWEKSRAAGPQHAWPDSWLKWGDLEREQEILLRRRQSAFGFPFICLWYERSGGLSMFGSAMRLSGGYEINKALGRERTGFVAEAALGYRPIWRGLISNIALFGAMWFGLLALLGRWRDARARAAGSCVRCGYDLRGNAPGTRCPECGCTDSL